MKSFLLLSFLLALAAAENKRTNIISLPSNQDMMISLNYKAGSGTFELIWLIANNNEQLSDTRFIGMGFQNGLAENAAAENVSMYGPAGTDYFLLHGTSAAATVEFRTLGAVKPGYGKGQAPILREKYTSSATIPTGKRITDFSFKSESPASTKGGFTSYTVTIGCSKGTNGMVDFTKPVAVLFAFGEVVEGKVTRHAPNAQGRGWKRKDLTSTSKLILYTFCTEAKAKPSGVAMPSIFSFGTLLVAAALTLLVVQ